MLSVSTKGTPRGNIEHKPTKSRTSNATKKGGEKNDLWSENIHFTRVHEDPEDHVRLQSNQKHVKDQDQFVEYIRHVESKLTILFEPVLI